MNYIFKKVKVALPHCPKCGERLLGNGSVITPYKCKCGIWKINWVTHEYDIETNRSYSEVNMDLCYNHSTLKEMSEKLAKMQLDVVGVSTILDELQEELAKKIMTKLSERLKEMPKTKKEAFVPKQFNVSGENMPKN